MLHKRALLGSVALVTLLVAGGSWYAHASSSTHAPGPVAWSEVAGAGTIFPACGSAIVNASRCTTPGCQGATIGDVSCDPSTGLGYATLGWDFSAYPDLNNSMGQIQLTGPGGTNYFTPTGGPYCGYNLLCTGQVTGSQSVSGLAPGTYQYVAASFSEARYHESTGGEIFINFTVPSCSNPNSLAISKGEIIQQGQDCVRPGNVVNSTHNRICYRMNFANTGRNDQTNVTISDPTPANTTFYWQGGGADTNWLFGNASWWKVNTLPGGQGGRYVDFTTQLNAGVPVGTQICNTATIQSDQVAAFNSNTVCNTVSPLAPASVSAACSADNTSATISWPAATGATVYYPRVWIPSGTCPAGWTLYTDGHTCYKNSYAGTAITVPVTPGFQYSAWVHAGDPVDWTLIPPSTVFTCSAKPTVTSSCPAPGTSAPISWTAVAGATAYHVIVNIGAVASCPAGGWILGSWSAGNNYCDLATGPSTLSTTFTPTTPGTTYTTAVRAFFGGVGGDYSDISTFTCATVVSSCTVQHPTWYGPITVTGGQNTSGVPYPGRAWGSGPYTGDSDPAFGAVHAGELGMGQTATIQRIDAGTRTSFPGSTAHGITTTSYSDPAGFCAVTYQGPPPQGYLDGANCTTISGWAYDPKAPATSIPVHVYKDGPAGVGTFVGAFPTDVLRAGVNCVMSGGTWTGSSCTGGNGSVTGNHGFSIATPASLKDGVTHALYVYAINTNGTGPNPLIGNSPLSISCVASQPDLTAGAVTPTTASVGTSKQFSATITNQGTGPAPNLFKNFAQIDTDSNHASGNETSLGVTSPDVPAGFAASASTPVTFQHTFASAGTYYLRVCADLNGPGGADYNTESNEGNNCGPWATINVTTPAVPALTCSRSPAGIAFLPPTTVTYTAVASGGAAAPYTFKDPFGGTIVGDSGQCTGPSLTCVKTYSTSGNYSVSVDASNVPTPVACGVALTVGCSGLSSTIAANPTRLPATGGPTHVSWTASGVESSCIITANGTPVHTVTAASCSIGGDTSLTPDPTITEQTRYCISCDGATTGQTGFACVTVNLDSEFGTF